MFDVYETTTETLISNVSGLQNALFGYARKHKHIMCTCVCVCLLYIYICIIRTYMHVIACILCIYIYTRKYVLLHLYVFSRTLNTKATKTTKAQRVDDNIRVEVAASVLHFLCSLSLLLSNMHSTHSTCLQGSESCFRPQVQQSETHQNQNILHKMSRLSLLLADLGFRWTPLWMRNKTKAEV